MGFYQISVGQGESKQQVCDFFADDFSWLSCVFMDEAYLAEVCDSAIVDGI